VAAARRSRVCVDGRVRPLSRQAITDLRRIHARLASCNCVRPAVTPCIDDRAGDDNLLIMRISHRGPLTCFTCCLRTRSKPKYEAGTHIGGQLFEFRVHNAIQGLYRSTPFASIPIIGSCVVGQFETR